MVTLKGFAKQKQIVRKDKVGVAEQKEASLDELLFMVKSPKALKRKHTWYIDSGCSNHITSNDELFITPDRNFRTIWR